jgi:hypothetical protein
MASYLTKRAKAAFLNLAELQPHIMRRDWAAVRDTGLDCVLRVLAEKESDYLPNFKWMDFVANAVTLTRSIASETQMHTNEACALLRSMLSDQSESVRRVRLEAALERARYEPMMLQKHDIQTHGSERRAILHLRWEKMKQAQNEHYVIADPYMQCANDAVHSAITSPTFRQYRIGPLLQLFAEILHVTRASATEGEPCAELKRSLSPDGTLWRSYALKSGRYQKKNQRLPTMTPPLDSRHLH